MLTYHFYMEAKNTNKRLRIRKCVVIPIIFSFFLPDFFFYEWVKTEECSEVLNNSV